MGKNFQKVRLTVISLLVTASLLVVSCQQAAPAPTQAPAGPTKAAAPAAAPTSAPAAAAAATAAPAAPAAQPTSAPAAAAPTPLKLGLAVAITGAAATFGVSMEHFIRMGIDMVNAKGGVKVGGKTYTFEGVTADTLFTSEGARIAANRLVLQDKVKYLLGPMTMEVSGAQAITEPSNVLLVSFSAPQEGLGPKHPLTFHTGITHMFIRVPAPYEWLAKERPNAKKVAMIGIDKADGKTNNQILTVTLKRLGMQGISEDYFPQDIKDFAPIVTRVLAKNPDIIDIGDTAGLATIGAGLVKELNTQKYKGIVVGNALDSNILRDQGQILSSFGEFLSSAMVDPNTPLITKPEKDVTDAYVKKYGEKEMVAGAAPGYNMPWYLAQAMEKAQTIDDTQKLADTLRNGEWDSFYGKVKFVGAQTFGSPSILGQPVYVFGMKDGKAVGIARVPGTLP